MRRDQLRPGNDNPAAIAALVALERALPEDEWDVTIFNDGHGHKDVLKLYDMAICEAEQAEADQQ